MDFTEINSRGKRGELLGRIDRQNSRFRTAKTTVIKFGLYASFVELESAKNAVNETCASPFLKPQSPGQPIGVTVHFTQQPIREQSLSSQPSQKLFSNSPSRRSTEATPPGSHRSTNRRHAT
ncbi:uncharacterized protein TNCV_3756081 [Trichonephila clavipes]|nr:uncharacterized protein TNCV_3756081 [Trichonephila clavipes]